MNRLRAGPENPVRALVGVRPYQHGGSFRPRLPVPATTAACPALLVAKGTAGTRTRLGGITFERQ